VLNPGVSSRALLGARHPLDFFMGGQKKIAGPAGVQKIRASKSGLARFFGC
jgi:hypothetical protein